MGWLSGLCRLSSMQWIHHQTIQQAPTSGGFRISSYLTEYTTRYNRLILRQAILTARTSYFIVSGYT